MTLHKCKLGELITQRREKNNDDSLPISGVSKEGLIPPKQQEADTSLYNMFYRGDFIFNPARMELNSIAYNDKYDKAICSSLYEVFFVHRTDLILPEYLALIVKQDWFTRYCEFLGQGSAREYCRFVNISEIEIEFPDLTVQQKTVHCYNVIKRRIELKQRINDNLAVQATTYIQQELINYPDAWRTLKVSDLIKQDLIDPPMDGNHGEIHPKASDYVSKGIPFLMANNLVDGTVDYNNCAFITESQANSLRKGFARPGDVLLTHKATIGRIAILPDTYPLAILTPQVTYYRTKNGLYNGFLRYYFETNKFQTTLSAWSGAGSTRAYIGITKQLELPIDIPNSQLMNKIRRFIEPIEKVRNANFIEINNLQQIKEVVLSTISSH